MRNKTAGLVLALAIGLGGLSGAGSVSARDYDYNERPSGPQMWVDAFLVRPMTLVAAGFGFASWVLALPVSIPAGNADQAGMEWVAYPLKYTFMRPLGVMEEGAEPAYVQESSSL